MPVKKPNSLLLFLMAVILCMQSCTYRKGDAYQYTQAGDNLRFIVKKAGSGQKIIREVSKLTVIHTNRNDDYRFIYLTDSSALAGHKTLLLFHTEMPDFEEDFLEKGYLGAFGTKEIVTYMIVTAEDLNLYFSAAGPEK